MAGSAWVEHVKKFYLAKKSKNPGYKYSQAMKEARASYKKKGAATAAEPKKKTRKARKSKKADKEEESEKVGGSMGKKRVVRKKKVKILKM